MAGDEAADVTDTWDTRRNVTREPTEHTELGDTDCGVEATRAERREGPVRTGAQVSRGRRATGLWGASGGAHTES